MNHQHRMNTLHDNKILKIVNLLLRLPPKSDLEQSPDVLPVNERNSNRRSQSPDLIARKSGIIRRGQGVSPSY